MRRLEGLKDELAEIGEVFVAEMMDGLDMAEAEVGERLGEDMARRA